MTVPPGRVQGIHASAEALAALAGAGARIALGDGRRSGASNSGRLGSRLRGRGMEFAETRVYTPGDDVRNMDWRVTARTGTAHTKLYEEERERPVLLLVDFSPSMFFGTRVALKSVLAAEVATLLAWAAVTRGDRAGTITFGVAGLHETRPAGGRRGALTCIRALVRDAAPPVPGNTPADTPTLDAALQHARRVCRPGSLVFIISDFADPGAETRRHLARLRQHADVVACKLFDRLECDPPAGARLALSDGKQRLLLDTGDAVTRTRWREHFAARRAACRELLQAQAVPLLEIATDDDAGERLRASLGASARRPGRRGPARRAA